MHIVGAVIVVLFIVGGIGSAVYFLSGLFGRRVYEGTFYPHLAPEEYADREFPEPKNLPEAEDIYVVIRRGAPDA